MLFFVVNQTFESNFNDLNSVTSRFSRELKQRKILNDANDAGKI